MKENIHHADYSTDPIEKIIAKNMQFRTPDITFILDLPADLAVERIHKRGSPKEKFEELEFMKELRKNFLRLKEELDDNIKNHIDKR